MKAAEKLRGDSQNLLAEAFGLERPARAMGFEGRGERPCCRRMTFGLAERARFSWSACSLLPYSSFLAVHCTRLTCLGFRLPSQDRTGRRTPLFGEAARARRGVVRGLGPAPR